MDIREIENIIDHIHENHPAFNQSKEQLVYELLTAFEDLCSLAMMASMLNPLSMRKITEYMDSLNMALQWVEQKNISTVTEKIQTDISETRYEKCVSLLTEYAYPYSVICSGYISFSRNRLTATIDGNVVTFNITENQNNSSWSDILREASDSSLDKFISLISPIKISRAYENLKQNINIEDGKLYYKFSDSISAPFREIATEHWDVTKTLPESWKFDLFSLEEYKTFWICLATLCYMHFMCCFTINDPLTRIQNSTIIQPIDCIINYIVSMSGLDKTCIETILDYITFDPTKKNAEIMYQPIVKLGNDMLIIAPMLIMGSNPERNLLAVVSTKKDKEYSKEVNDLEDLMIHELEAAISKTDNIKIVKRKNLGEKLPDIDFAILDNTSNAALICELKWFAAADSTKEVYAKEDEITHGCNQIDSIMSYAMSNKKNFINQVFGVDNEENIDLFCCVVAKNNIRTQNKYVPVIDLKRIKELFSTFSLNGVFHIIRNHKYEIELPDDATITHQEIKYGEYIFKIPAICFGVDMP